MIDKPKLKIMILYLLSSTFVHALQLKQQMLYLQTDLDFAHRTKMPTFTIVLFEITISDKEFPAPIPNSMRAFKQIHDATPNVVRVCACYMLVEYLASELGISLVPHYVLCLCIKLYSFMSE